MATRGGVQALGLEDRIGSLAAGKRADIVLVRRTDLNLSPALGDPAQTLLLSGEPGNVDTVFVDGRRLVRKGNLVALDAAAVARDAARTAREFKARDQARGAKPAAG
ncbi:MAG: amidohydrolase family protein [Candidatus Protistobacter heckmanni]|nr:amidohydrolase family protein [Candidatus Protistobacter heckmanni]